MKQLRLLPKGTYVRSLTLQERICFEEDMIIEIDMFSTNDRSYYGTVQILLFEHMMPTLLPKLYGEISGLYDDTYEYEISL